VAVSETFDDGQPLSEAVCEQQLEGVVVKAAVGPLRLG
jgi:ATP-dependent DNA ligase